MRLILSLKLTFKVRLNKNFSKKGFIKKDEDQLLTISLNIFTNTLKSLLIK